VALFFEVGFFAQNCRSSFGRRWLLLGLLKQVLRVN